MGKLLAVAIMVGLAYLFLTQAQEQFGESLGFSGGALSEEGQASEACIDSVEYANNLFAEDLRRHSPPVNQDAWSATMSSINGLLNDAQEACFCSTEACDKASEALDELKSLVWDFDSLASGTAVGWSNPGTRQERIQRLLRSAESLIEH